MTKGKAEDRFWSKVEKTDDCWLWKGATTKGAGEYHYGSFHYQGKTVRVHRFAYELLVGDIPEGLTIDHLCRETLCVNPEHLEAVTHRENVLRGIGPSAQHSKKTHCPYGHPYNGDNLAYSPKRSRVCKECRRRTALAAYHKNRAITDTKS